MVWPGLQLSPITCIFPSPTSGMGKADDPDRAGFFADSCDDVVLTRGSICFRMFSTKGLSLDRCCLLLTEALEGLPE